MDIIDERNKYTKSINDINNGSAFNIPKKTNINILKNVKLIISPEN